ncbi:hypothetical protein EVAR_11148_1 [Eumeta japonica]|uniref:Uncharacterized protein n=1 Tax=Eumeta variegata TaxID=151549 RepID=A0A4C1U4R8_EUMVA|nr:hypothetical protein EVAR_11148_1 [Eumeta japonica]
MSRATGGRALYRLAAGGAPRRAYSPTRRRRCASPEAIVYIRASQTVRRDAPGRRDIVPEASHVDATELSEP